MVSSSSLPHQTNQHTPSRRPFPAWYARLALRSGSHFVGGDSDPKFAAVSAHGWGAFRARGPADGGARVLGDFPANGLCHYGSGGGAPASGPLFLSQQR